MAAFATGEDVWIRNLGNLRNTIRQEVVHRQLAGHLTPGMTVLDVGCGQAGSLERLDDVMAGRRFDLVCAHGLLMYLPDRTAAIATLARRVAPGGLLSVTVRNGHALAMRPALRREWTATLIAFDGHGYVNELGVSARADRFEDVQGDLLAVGMDVAAWYGVRIFNDAVPVEMDVPVDEDLAALLEAEDRAGRIDPYRWIGSQMHVIARSQQA